MMEQQVLYFISYKTFQEMFLLHILYYNICIGLAKKLGLLSKFYN